MPTLIPVATAVEICAQGIDPRLSASLVRQESNFNPYAIGLDGKAVLKAQPKTYEEAVKTAVNLMREGKGFSVGLSQVHISNVVRYGMSWQEAFDPCTNMRAGSTILKGFYSRAVQAGYRDNDAVFAALRGFNSGDVRNPVSNGYARNILGRVASGPVMPPVSNALAVANLQPQRGEALTVLPGMKRPVADDSSPDMFSTPSTSMFPDAVLQTADAQQEPAAVAVAESPVSVAKQAVREVVADDDSPVVLQATRGP